MPKKYGIKKQTKKQTDEIRITPTGADGWVPAGLLMDSSTNATVRWKKGTDIIGINRDNPA